MYTCLCLGTLELQVRVKLELLLYLWLLFYHALHSMFHKWKIFPIFRFVFYLFLCFVSFDTILLFFHRQLTSHPATTTTTIFVICYKVQNNFKARLNRDVVECVNKTHLKYWRNISYIQIYLFFSLSIFRVLWHFDQVLAWTKPGDELFTENLCWP